MHAIQTITLQRTIHLVSVLCVFLTLAGCAGMNSSFNCPMKPGQMCSSLDQVNRMIDQGKIGSNTDHANESNTLLESADNVPAGVSDPTPTTKTGEPLRYGESVLRIWVAPYEDKAGTYHQPSIMYALLRPGRWIGHPVEAVIND